MQDYIERTIRNLVIGNLPDVKKLMLSPRMVDGVKYIASKSDGVLSTDIATKFNISVQNASMHLTNLYKAGYLVRREIKADTGGTQFIYWVAPDLQVN